MHKVNSSANFDLLTWSDEIDNIYTYLEFSTKNAGAIAQSDKGGDLISWIFHPELGVTHSIKGICGIS